jgi:glycine betaine/proline transport system substrate-binding protein
VIIGRFAVTPVMAAVLMLVGCGARHAEPELLVGAAPEPESVLLAQVYAGALRFHGTAARVESAPDPLSGLDTGALTVVPGFTGRLLQRFQPGATPISDLQVYRAMVAALPEGVAAGDYATEVQNKPVVAVTAATATAWGGRELTALVRHCGQLAAGTVAAVGPPAAVGGCTLPAAREFPDDAALFDALRAGRINAAWTTTADPNVPADVVVLADRHPPLVQAENVVPLYRRNQLTELQFLAVNQVAGELDTAALADMRRQVADGADPHQVADNWLAAHPLGR